MQALAGEAGIAMAPARPTEKAPLNPYLVLLVAILLPGFGHVLAGHARRGMTMQLFMIVFAFVTWHFAAPNANIIGKLSGGLFIYALSLPEAYRYARIRQAEYQHARGDSPAADQGA